MGKKEEKQRGRLGEGEKIEGREQEREGGRGGEGEWEREGKCGGEGKGGGRVLRRELEKGAA